MPRARDESVERRGCARRLRIHAPEARRFSLLRFRPRAATGGIDAMSRLQIFPPAITLYPLDRQLFTAQAVPPPAMWDAVATSGDIGGDYILFVDAAQSNTSAQGAHRLFSGIGIVECTITDNNRPDTGGIFVMNGFIRDINGALYAYLINVNPTTIVITDENTNTLFNQNITVASGDVLRLELTAGFRFYRNGVLLHSRVGLPTAVTYPMSYQLGVFEPSISATSAIPPPRLIGDWRLAEVVDWTAPAHGSISTIGPSTKTEYFNGTIPGVYTLTGQIEALSDANLAQRALATITIPPLQILGPTEVVLQPSQKIRFKTNYDAAQTSLITWSVFAGGGSFSQGEYTAGSSPGTSIVRATASVNGQIADITVTVPAVITNTSNYTAAKASEQIDFDTNIPTSMLPIFAGAGSVAEGTGNITPSLPVGIQINDIMLLFVQTANESVSTPSGWTAVADSPQGTGTGGAAGSVRITVFWRRVTLTEGAPTITDPGDHAVAQIWAFRGCPTSGDPWDVTSGNTGASSTSVSIPGDTTTVANCLVVLVVANATDTATPQTSGYTNADLANLTEGTDFNSTQGVGGGFAIITGQKVAAGAYGATTATLATASAQGRMSIALKPGTTVWSASAGSINTSSGLWTAPSLTGQTALINATNGILTVQIAVPVLEAFPRTDYILPWPIDLTKRVLTSDAEDGSRAWRVKNRAKRSFPVTLFVCPVSDLVTIRDFWDRHHPGVRFI